MTNNVKRRLTMRYSLLLFSLVCVLVSMLVAYVGIKRQLDQSESSVNVFSVPGYRVEELEEAVAQIEVGVSTRADVNRLIGPYVDSRGRYRLKGTGADRDYFFVLRDRQLWVEFATGVDGWRRCQEWENWRPGQSGFAAGKGIISHSLLPNRPGKTFSVWTSCFNLPVADSLDKLAPAVWCDGRSTSLQHTNGR